MKRTPRRRKKPHPEEPAVVRELERRVFADPDDCRVAWEKAANPLALCEALMVADTERAPPPEWLCDALLLTLLAEDQHDRGLQSILPVRGRLERLETLWHRSHNRSIDANRAAGGIAARVDLTTGALLGTEADAYAAADPFVMRRNGPSAGSEAFRKSIARVRSGLKNEGAYWQADEAVLGRLLAALKRRFPGQI
jgi:hypothetical protein